MTAYVGVPTSLGSTLLLAWERLLGEWRNSVYAHGSGPCPREGVGVRVPPRPLSALRLSNRGAARAVRGSRFSTVLLPRGDCRRDHGQEKCRSNSCSEMTTTHDPACPPEARVLRECDRPSAWHPTNDGGRLALRPSAGRLDEAETFGARCAAARRREMRLSRRRVLRAPR